MKFETQLPVNKRTLWVIQNYKILIQNGGGRYFVFYHKTFCRILYRPTKLHARKMDRSV